MRVVKFINGGAQKCVTVVEMEDVAAVYHLRVAKSERGCVRSVHLSSTWKVSVRCSMEGLSNSKVEVSMV